MDDNEYKVKAELEGWRETIKEITEKLSGVENNLQNVHTPFDLVYNIIGKLNEYTELKDKTFCVFNLEFIEVLCYDFNVPLEKIWFITDCKQKEAIAKSSRYNGVNVMKKDFFEMLKEKNEERKFDVVLMNPPYKGSLHLKFLQRAVDIAKDGGRVICVHPSTWLFMGNKGNKTKKIYNSTKDMIANYNTKLVFFNANKMFNVSMFMPFCITSIHKSEKDSDITVKNDIINKVFTYDNIYDVNKFGNYKEYYSLLSKISKQAKRIILKTIGKP